MRGRSRGATYEYGRRGMGGWVHDHALATVMAVMLTWIVAVCAIVASFGALS